MALAFMAGTFAMGWTTRGGVFLRLPILSASALHGAAGPAPALVEGGRPADEITADSNAIAVGPALGAPIAEAEVPVVFPGYVLPDDSREEPAHEGS